MLAHVVLALGVSTIIKKQKNVLPSCMVAAKVTAIDSKQKKTVKPYAKLKNC